MRPVARTRLAVAAVAAVAAFAWARPSLTAAPPAPPFAGGDAEKAPWPVPRVYFKEHMTPDAARIWVKLQQKVPMKFPGEVPLEEVLKTLREATKDEGLPAGLPIYVDPVGLTEAEKTMASPVTIDLDPIRLETGLKLALKQLDLAFRIHPDGLLVITSATTDGEAEPDGMELILDKLDALQKEVAKLRLELGHGAAKK